MEGDEGNDIGQFSRLRRGNAHYDPLLVSIMAAVETMREAGAGRFRVRMASQPSSVPTSRRFVEEALASWERPELLDDLVLCVSELSTNATLHSGSGYFDVELACLGDAVRLVVVDGGGTSARAIAARADTYLDEVVLGDDQLITEGMTGRGLFIVSALAEAWGIEDTDGGTMVWADFRAAGMPAKPTTPQVSAARPESDAPPADLMVVRLDRCPPGLLLAHDENLADIVRELQLMGPGAGPVAMRVLEDISTVVRESAVSWDAARLQARGAIQAGERYVDVAVLASAQLPEVVRRLREAVDVAERLAADGVLMTMPAAEPVQRLRAWMQDQMVSQTVRRADPVPYPEWTATH